MHVDSPRRPSPFILKKRNEESIRSSLFFSRYARGTSATWRMGKDFYLFLLVFQCNLNHNTKVGNDEILFRLLFTLPTNGYH